MIPKLTEFTRRKPRPRRTPTLHGNAVTWTILHAYILNRDKVCLAYLFELGTAYGADGTHECKDRYGWPHDPFNRGKLSLEHVPDPNVKGLGMRREIAAPDDELHLVAMCHGENVRGPSEALRNFCRDWIATKERTD